MTLLDCRGSMSTRSGGESVAGKGIAGRGRCCWYTNPGLKCSTTWDISDCERRHEAC